MYIVIDWSATSTESDFYRSLLSQLQAPPWHGHNFDAIADSIGVGSVNGVEPPYSISIVNLHRVQPALLCFSEKVVSVLRNAAAARGNIEVTVLGVDS